MSLAVVTMIYNEKKMLPLWVNYYGNQVGFSNLYVIDNDSSDDCLKILPDEVSVIRYPKGNGFSDNRRARFVSSFCAGLLNVFESVIYVDCDEFVVPDPGVYSGLQDYQKKMKSDFVTPVGLNLCHKIDEEEDLDFDKKILNQRSYVTIEPAMCKPCLTKKPLSWGGGFHSCDRPPNLCSDIYLFHLKDVDFSSRLERQKLTREIVWEKNVSKDSGPGRHQRSSDEVIVNRFNRRSKWPVHDLNNSVVNLFINAANNNLFFIDSGREARKIRIKFSEVGWFNRNLYKLDNKFRNIF